MSTENKNETPAGGTKPASKQRGPRRAPRAPKAAPKAVAPQQEAQASRPPKGAARSGKPADKAVLSLPNPNTNGAPAAPKPAPGIPGRRRPRPPRCA